MYLGLELTTLVLVFLWMLLNVLLLFVSKFPVNVSLSKFLHFLSQLILFFVTLLFHVLWFLTQPNVLLTIFIFIHQINFCVEYHLISFVPLWIIVIVLLLLNVILIILLINVFVLHFQVQFPNFFNLFHLVLKQHEQQLLFCR